MKDPSVTQLTINPTVYVSLSLTKFSVMLHNSPLHLWGTNNMRRLDTTTRYNSSGTMNKIYALCIKFWSFSRLLTCPFMLPSSGTSESLSTLFVLILSIINWNACHSASCKKIPSQFKNYRFDIQIHGNRNFTTELILLQHNEKQGNKKTNLWSLNCK